MNDSLGFWLALETQMLMYYADLLARLVELEAVGTSGEPARWGPAEVLELADVREAVAAFRAFPPTRPDQWKEAAK